MHCAFNSVTWHEVKHSLQEVILLQAEQKFCQQSYHVFQYTYYPGSLHIYLACYYSANITILNNWMKYD
jgi:hypothetical protein